jgi:hypothetical protein
VVKGRRQQIGLGRGAKAPLNGFHLPVLQQIQAATDIKKMLVYN